MALKTEVKQVTEKSFPEQYKFTATGTFPEIMAVIKSLRQNKKKIANAVELSEHVEKLISIESRLTGIQFSEAAGFDIEIERQLLIGNKIANTVNNSKDNE